jgi:hypothetical protein
MPAAIRDAVYMDVNDATVADAATALMAAAAKHRAQVAAPEPRS